MFFGKSKQYMVMVIFLSMVCCCFNNDRSPAPALLGPKIENDLSAEIDKGESISPLQDRAQGDSLDIVTEACLHTDNPILCLAFSNQLFSAQTWLKVDAAVMQRIRLQRISEYDQYIKKIARRYGFDWRLIAAQIKAESNFNESAQSPKGALGLMQVLPSTAHYLGFDSTTLINPETNIAIGCLYNQRMYSMWQKKCSPQDRIALTFASYNAGPNRVLGICKAQNSTQWGHIYKRLPEETQAYVHKIFLKHHWYKKYVRP